MIFCYLHWQNNKYKFFAVSIAFNMAREGGAPLKKIVVGFLVLTLVAGLSLQNRVSLVLLLLPKLLSVAHNAEQVPPLSPKWSESAQMIDKNNVSDFVEGDEYLYFPN